MEYPVTTFIHPDLINTIDRVFKPLLFNYSTPIVDKENIEYGAYFFELNSAPVIFRSAKITPTKVGQFVTLWKRSLGGPIEPYDIADQFEFFIIATSSGDNSGSFIFPKAALLKHDVISKNGLGGKRGIRVYPPWDIAINNQARKSQKWQLEYFLDLARNKPVDFELAKVLYQIIG
jgi:hypothetical protein